MRLNAISKLGVLLGIATLLAGCGGSGNGVRNDRLYIMFYDDVNDENVLASISSAQPGNVAVIGSFSYLSNSIFGLDRRPANDGLYVYSGDDNRLLRINASNGTHSIVGQNDQDPAMPVGTDFNPVADRLRVVNTADLNFRINPDTGVTAGVDTNLNPDSDIADIAYTNNQAGAVTTTLYGIDRVDGNLVRIGGIDGTPSANGGVVTVVGPLGLVFGPDDTVWFDVDENGNAWMLAGFWNGLEDENELYSVNLTTGAATFVGTVNNNMEMVGMTAR